MKILKPLIILLFIGAFFSCETEDTTAKKRFIITSSGAGFIGYFIADGEDPVTCNSLTKESAEYYYKYSHDLDANTSSIYLNIDGYSTDVNSIQLLIYNDDTLVSSETATPNSYTNKTNLTHSYTFTTASSSSN
jgi:hypothetical protein